ncbi:MAG: beta galactosidase jelly roll domain-containing protein [Actinomycetota bacterium]|nr:beta galactosidase jelly roll domain-containing protein [Actinomycetota bacterium]
MCATSPHSPSQALKGWDAVPIAAPLTEAIEAASLKRAWSPVRVPGHWQLEDNFVAYEGLVLYRCRFASQPSTQKRMVSLRFGGVYYSARVWLNGTYLGEHEGYFSPFEFDVTDVLVAGQNELLVEVHSPEEPEENERETIGGVWAGWDGLGPRINPGGIFREVELISSGEVRIRSLGAIADASGYGQTHIEVYARQRALTKLTGRVQPLGFEAPGAEFEREVRVEEGTNRFAIDFYLPQVRPWSTWDRGEQQLYEMTISCDGNEDTVQFGARTVELRNWQVYLNGERVFLRGINYLPTDVYPARALKERLHADASLVHDAGMNAARVHVHVAEKGFYEACDELGLLVLQDFPLQWTHQRSVLEPAVAQAAEMARDLRSYPSVGVYLVHDEPFYVVPPEKWSLPNLVRTAVEVLSPRWALWQRRVLDPAVVRSIREEDLSRPVIDAAGHPLTTNHLYFGWYYGRFKDLERFVRIIPGLARLPTGYGAQALPDLESLEEIWPSEKDPDWEVLSLNYRLQAQRMLRYVPWEGDRAGFVRKTQEYQAEVLKHATELFRRRKYRPTGGTFAFMLNDPAPAVSWSILDWRRRPKRAYEILKTAMNPVLICAEYPQENYEPDTDLSLPLFVVNDRSRGLHEVSWSWEVLIGGSSIACDDGVTEIPADSVVEIGEAKATLSASGSAVLRLHLSGRELTAYNQYEFRVREVADP